MLLKHFRYPSFDLDSLQYQSMVDCLTIEQRSFVMSRIPGKDTTIEVILRSALHREGFRFRKHVRGMPGTPDIVFTRARVAVFIDGDFWHGYKFPQWGSSLPEFWQEKIKRNRNRDRRYHAKLRRSGWKVLRIWEHQIRKDLAGAVDRVAQLLCEE